MKAKIKIILPVLIFIFLKTYGQANNIDKLKVYDWFVEHNMECKKCISQKKHLENGKVILVETFSKRNNIYKNLISKYKYEYDSLGNRIGYLKYNLKDLSKNHKENYKTKYSKEGYVLSETIDCVISEYDDFTKDGKPKLILRKSSDDCSVRINLNPYKIELIYDESGNINKAIYHHTKTQFQKDKIEALSINQTVTIWFTYDENDNIKTLKRAYDPPEEFPVEIWNGHIGGGMSFLYENESYSYVYNKNGLWTKKYQIVNGKETLVAKRKYKRK